LPGCRAPATCCAETSISVSTSARPTPSISSLIATRDWVIKSTNGNSSCPFFLRNEVSFSSLTLACESNV
jgi:hypothetical protein